MLELKVDLRAQTSMGAFFGAKRKSQCLSGDSDDSGVWNKFTVDMSDTNSSDICKANDTNTSTKNGYINTFVGIIIIQSIVHKKAIRFYTQYA